MRVVFMGTPDFAASILIELKEQHDVVAVYTRADAVRGRGKKLVPSPVKEVALGANIPVFEPRTLRDEVEVERLRALNPDVICVAAYGMILPQAVLDIPKHGCLNVHASLLPKYRGAAPINWAILNGERETGVTIMYMAKELDAGDVILCRETAIDPDEDAQTLTARLAALGADALAEAVERLHDGTAVRLPQDHSAYTYAPMLDRSLSPLDFSKSARQLHDQVRGLIPWPCASMTLDGKNVKIYRTAVGGETALAAGKIAEAGKQGLAIACGDGRLLRILELQAEGGKRMAAADYLRGHPVQVDA